MSLIKRLLSTTTQQDVKVFDHIITNVMKNTNCANCNKCEQVSLIIKPRVTLVMEREEEIKYKESKNNSKENIKN